MMTLGMNPFINAQGFCRTGMTTVALGAVTNIVLDPIFIFALDMGVRGRPWPPSCPSLLGAVGPLLPAGQKDPPPAGVALPPAGQGHTPGGRPGRVHLCHEHHQLHRSMACNPTLPTFGGKPI